MTITSNFLSCPAITISDLSLSYQGEFLFDHLNFTLTSNQWTVLLGPSGVGKTSLLRFIAGLTSDAYSTTPVATSDGLPLQGRITYMPQQNLLMPWLSVLNNVLITSRLKTISSNMQVLTERAIELLIKLDLGNVINKKPTQLSGGMCQRVALARTLLENRPVVLMDEPFSALDVITRAQLQELAAELLVDKTILLVTHDPLEALRLGHRIYVMSGRPAQIGAPLLPQGKIPRPVSDPKIFQLQGQLLEELAKAKYSL